MLEIKKNLNQKHVENKKNIDVKLEKFNLINYLIKILNKIFFLSGFLVNEILIHDLFK